MNNTESDMTLVIKLEGFTVIIKITTTIIIIIIRVPSSKPRCLAYLFRAHPLCMVIGARGSYHHSNH